MRIKDSFKGHFLFLGIKHISEEVLAQKMTLNHKKEEETWELKTFKTAK